MSDGSTTPSPLASNRRTYVKPFVDVADVVSVLVTTTFTAPTPWAGVLAVIFVELTTTTLVALLPPNVTVAPAWNPVPLMVIDVPPFGGPLLGTMLVIVTVGAAAVTLT